MKRNTIFLMGNGFAIDFNKCKNMNINSSKPFSLSVPCKEPKIENILNELPNLKNYISLKRSQGVKDDFEICHHLLLDIINSPNEKSLQWIHGEMRQYFSLTYSLMQIIYDFNLNDWHYINKFKKIHDSLLGCISFNYDLLLERVLALNNIRYYRYGIANENGIIPVFKPHGSIDFEAGPGTIDIQPIISRFKNQTFLCECKPMISIDPYNYLVPRILADIVLPSEPSPQQRLSWVKGTYEWFKDISPYVKNFVIIGISYWICDRMEIDQLIDVLPKSCTIHIINPCPPPCLIDKIEKKKINYTINSFFE